MKLDKTYEEKVYAGVLGKLIGVYLGRPFEQWSHERIMEELGEINYYVNEQLNVPLVVTDDDITGTFTFLRALRENNYDPNISPKQIGQSWLNNLIENKTVLWWGGRGHSAEDTAYQNLKAGIEAPMSGSIETNGKVVAEQIGAQIFIDGWALVTPGDPEKAADLARRAGSVSHDGEAIYGAQMVAAMESLAFVETDINKIIDESKKYANLLGYNYQSSKWYEETYRILNKDYAKISKRKEKRFSIDNKFDFDSIDAKVVDGLLTLSIPYKAEVKPRKIKVN